jgi:VIT1/CCC1 family predicted Fe2+/Mn2+ transporter
MDVNMNVAVDGDRAQHPQQLLARETVVPTVPTEADIRRYRENWQEEVDSAFQYRAMADGEPRTEVAAVYRDLAATEEKHAHFWEDRLKQAGKSVGPAKPSWRARLLSTIARRIGPGLVLPTVASREYIGRNGYAAQVESAPTSMAAQERTHARVLQSLLNRSPSGAEGSVLARLEGRHRAVGGNALRAAVLGANDGLCSNLSLVMGVAGATSTSTSEHALILTGLAGLLAGACSMALGEWVSVTSSRELAERELRIEADEVRENPEDEREELQLIYEAKGLKSEEARHLSSQLFRDPKAALEVLSREELGLTPDELAGSARVAALSSFLLFALGAAVPLVPLLFLHRSVALFGSLAASALGLIAIGIGISVFTGRPAWRSALRQLLLGLAAAGLTFGIGHLLGSVVAG